MLISADPEPKRNSSLIPVVLLFVAMLGVSALGGAAFYSLHRDLAESKNVANEALTKADVLRKDLQTSQEQNLELKRRVDSLAVETSTLREKNTDLEKKVASKPAENGWNLDGPIPHIVINGAEVTPGIQTHTFTLGQDGNTIGGGIKFSITTPEGPKADAPPPSAKKKGVKDEAF